MKADLGAVAPVTIPEPLPPPAGQRDCGQFGLRSLAWYDKMVCLAEFSFTQVNMFLI